MFKVLLALMLLMCAAPSVRADVLPIVQRLEHEERTWHKYHLFATASVVTDPSEYLATLEWLRDRLTSKKATDSRYAITYSLMLLRTGRESMRGEALAFALVGYNALQLETARCEDRREALQIARQWYGHVRGQLNAFGLLPKEKRLEMYALSQRLAVDVVSPPADNASPGPYWICYLLPAYTAAIMKEPDARVEQYSDGPWKVVFVSHPTLRPSFVADETFSQRRNVITAEITKFALAD